MRIAWSGPREPNGVITGYRVAFGFRSYPMSTVSDDSVPAESRDYQVTGLVSHEHYLFTVAAKTQSGWGAEESVVVYTSSVKSELVHWEWFADNDHSFYNVTQKKRHSDVEDKHSVIKCC